MSTILPVAQRGESILTLTAAEVAKTELNSPWLKELAEAMHATMLARNGVGIAAPQVYVSKRVIIEVNRRICEITGYQREELLGQSARILYPSDDEFEWVGREK